MDGVRHANGTGNSCGKDHYRPGPAAQSEPDGFGGVDHAQSSSSPIGRAGIPPDRFISVGGGVSGNSSLQTNTSIFESGF